MQQSNRTVIFGEAPEESDSEDFELNNEDTGLTSQQYHEHHLSGRDKPDKVPDISGQTPPRQRTKNKIGIFGSSLFANIAGPSSSTLAMLATYSPYELLSSTIGQPNLITTVGKDDRLFTEMKDSPTTSSFDGNTTQLGKQSLKQFPPLHRTLFTKNHQFLASMNHLHKHPLKAATKAVNSLSQCLVMDQKIIQELSSAMVKIQQEQENFSETDMCIFIDF